MRIALIGIFLILKVKGDGDRCNQIFNTDSLFSLSSLAGKDDYKYDFVQNGVKFTLTYNFCAKVKSSCKGKYPYAILNDEKGNCFALTSDSVLSDYFIDLIDPDNVNSGLIYIQTNGDNYNASLNYSISFTVRCNQKADSPFEFKYGYLVNNNFLVSIESKSGCPIIVLSNIWEFFDNHWFIVAILLMSAGFLLTFFGYSMLKPVLYLIGFFTGFLGLSFVWAEFLVSPTTHYALIALLLLVSAFAGVGVGYLLINLPRIGITVACVWMGILLAFLIFTLFFSGFKTNPDNLILWILWWILGGTFGVLGFLLWKDIIIFVTAANGSYCAIKGFSMLFGGFPNPLTIAKSLKYKQIGSLPASFYIYCMLMVALAICGIFYQTQHKSEEDPITSSDLKDSGSKVQKEEENYVAMKDLNE